MTRTYFLIAMLFLSQGLSLSPCLASYEKFVDLEGNVSDPIVRCLHLTGIQIKGSPQNEETDQPKPVLTINSRNLEEVTKAVQGKISNNISWKMEGKRWEMHNPLLTSDAAKKILEIGFQDFSFKEPVYPRRKDYKGMILLGCSAERFHERVLFADQLPTKGIILNKIYIFTGQRALEGFEKEEFPFLKGVGDEGEMALEVFKKNTNAIPN